MIRRAASVALLVLLARPAFCRRSPTPRAVALGGDQLGLAGPAVSAAAEGWWQDFADPQLNRLVDQALADSPTMAQARGRLRAAVAQTDVARSALLPKATLSGNVAREHAPENYFIPPPLNGTSSWLGQGGVSLSLGSGFLGPAGRRGSQCTGSGRGGESVDRRLAADACRCDCPRRMSSCTDPRAAGRHRPACRGAAPATSS